VSTSFFVGVEGTLRWANGSKGGESVTLDVPLVFTTRPRALRIRLPRHAIGASPAGRSLRPRDAMVGVCRVAIGRPMQG
jgi:hypothetical protein